MQVHRRGLYISSALQIMECTLRSWFGYLHLSSSTPGTRKKCCANGRLSSTSNNFDKELMMDHELDRLPNFLRLLISSYCGFFQMSSIYNNLVAMAATVVCNYNNTAIHGVDMDHNLCLWTVMFITTWGLHQVQFKTDVYNISYLLTLDHFSGPLYD